MGIQCSHYVCTDVCPLTDPNTPIHRKWGLNSHDYRAVFLFASAVWITVCILLPLIAYMCFPLREQFAVYGVAWWTFYIVAPTAGASWCVSKYLKFRDDVWREAITKCQKVRR